MTTYKCAICGRTFVQSGIIDSETPVLTCNECGSHLGRCVTCKYLKTLGSDEFCPKGEKPFYDVVNGNKQVIARRISPEASTMGCVEFYEMAVLE